MALLSMIFAVGSCASFRFAYTSERAMGEAPESLIAIGLLAGFGAVVAGIVFAAMLKGVLNTRWTRLQHLYAITDRRVIMRTPTFDRLGIEVRVLDLPAVGKIHRTEYPDGLGTLNFLVVTGPRGIDPDHGAMDQYEYHSLEKIPAIRRVELLLRQSAAQSRSRATENVPEEFI